MAVAKRGLAAAMWSLGTAAAAASAARRSLLSRVLAGCHGHLPVGPSSVLPPPLALGCLGGARTVIRHPVKATGMILGHKLEVTYGTHNKKRRPINPPKVPKHPMQDLDQNMNEVLTYADLKLRWQWTIRFKKGLKLARHWKPRLNRDPEPRPTCSFIWHKDMPHRERTPELPEASTIPKVSTKDAFAVFKSGVYHQHKVTVGDLVQAERLHRREAGEKVVFGTVLFVGSKDYSIIGKPTVPYAKVKATIEQQTLTKETVNFKYKPKGRQGRFARSRHWVTMLRIDEIVVEPEADTMDPPPPKPVRLLDLWANRWLDPAEKAGIAMIEGKTGEGLIPKAAEIYDGSEHQPGTYHRRGLTSCYRFWPDPQHTHWRL